MSVATADPTFPSHLHDEVVHIVGDLRVEVAYVRGEIHARMYDDTTLAPTVVQPKLVNNTWELMFYPPALRDSEFAKIENEVDFVEAEKWLASLREWAKPLIFLLNTLHPPVAEQADT